MGYRAVPPLKLYISSLFFVLQTKKYGGRAQLVIERNTGKCYSANDFDPLANLDHRTLYVLDVFLLIGVLPINGVLFLGVVTEADAIDTLDNKNVYSVVDVDFIEVQPQRLNEETEDSKRNVTKLLENGFYFSYKCDLTLSMQKARGETGNLHEKSNKDFYWNYPALKDLISQGVHSQWFIPVIQGYIGVSRFYEKEVLFTIALVSRRS